MISLPCIPYLNFMELTKLEMLFNHYLEVLKIRLIIRLLKNM